MRQENQVTSYSMPGEICSLSIILEINGKIWGGEIWGCRKLQAGRWALTFGGKQLEGGMEEENLRRNESENLDVCSELWREKKLSDRRGL